MADRDDLILQKDRFEALADLRDPDQKQATPWCYSPLHCPSQLIAGRRSADAPTDKSPDKSATPDSRRHTLLE